MPKSVRYSRFCILVKVFAPMAIAKSYFSSIFKLRASYETSKSLKIEGNEHEKNYRKRNHLWLGCGDVEN